MYEGCQKFRGAATQSLQHLTASWLSGAIEFAQLSIGSWPGRRAWIDLERPRAVVSVGIPPERYANASKLASRPMFANCPQWLPEESSEADCRKLFDRSWPDGSNCFNRLWRKIACRSIDFLRGRLWFPFRESPSSSFPPPGRSFPTEHQKETPAPFRPKTIL